MTPINKHPVSSGSNSPESTASSPKVNFYILSGDDLTRRLQFVYRLIKQLYKRQLTILILTADKDQLQQLDRLLWTAEPEYFIPHEAWSETLQPPWPPIMLTAGNLQQCRIDFQAQVVIDLSYDANILDFPRLVLVANQHQDILSNARMKYQAYVNHGIHPTVHHIKD